MLVNSSQREHVGRAGHVACTMAKVNVVGNDLGQVYSFAGWGQLSKFSVKPDLLVGGDQILTTSVT